MDEAHIFQFVLSDKSFKHFLWDLEFDEASHAECEDECYGGYDDEVTDFGGALKLSFVELESFGLQMLEHGLNLEPFLVIAAGHFAQVHISEQENGFLKPFFVPAHGVCAVHSTVQEH